MPYLKIYFFLASIFALIKESVNNSVPERIDGELRYPDEVLPGEVALLCLGEAIKVEKIKIDRKFSC